MAATQILPASRSELHEFLKGDVLSGKFLELFDIRNEEINQAKYAFQLVVVSDNFLYNLVFVVDLVNESYDFL